jgi:hypothetical protein
MTMLDNVELEKQIRREHILELYKACCWVSAIVLWVIAGTIIKYTLYDLSWLIVLLPVLFIAFCLLVSFIGFMIMSFAAYSAEEKS